MATEKRLIPMYKQPWWGSYKSMMARCYRKTSENYADVLAKKRMIKESVDRSVHDHSVAIESDIKAQRFMWMAVVALNEAFGFGGERAKRFLLALQEVADEVGDLVNKHGAIYAKAKLIERVTQITGIEAKPVYEEEMRQARLENEAAGVYFPPDDPDKW